MWFTSTHKYSIEEMEPEKLSHYHDQAMEWVTMESGLKSR